MFGMPATQVPLGLTDDGLPLGVQVVAGAGHDHVSIAVALELERAAGGWVDPQDVRRDGLIRSSSCWARTPPAGCDGAVRLRPGRARRGDRGRRGASRPQDLEASFHATLKHIPFPLRGVVEEGAARDERSRVAPELHQARAPARRRPVPPRVPRRGAAGGSARPAPLDRRLPLRGRQAPLHQGRGGVAARAQRDRGEGDRVRAAAAIAARTAELLEPAKAADMVGRLSDRYLADVSAAMDPARAPEVIAQISPVHVAKVGAELARRGEWVIMGGFVSVVSRPGVARRGRRPGRRAAVARRVRARRPEPAWTRSPPC